MKQLMAAAGYRPRGLSELEQNEAEQRSEGSRILPKAPAAAPVPAAQTPWHGSQVVPSGHGEGDTSCVPHTGLQAWHHTAR